MIEKVNVAAVKRLLIARNLSLKELSQKSGLSKTTLYQIFKTGQAHSFQTFSKLVRGLDVDISEITCD